MSEKIVQLNENVNKRGTFAHFMCSVEVQG